MRLPQKNIGNTHGEASSYSPNNVFTSGHDACPLSARFGMLLASKNRTAREPSREKTKRGRLDVLSPILVVRSSRKKCRFCAETLTFVVYSPNVLGTYD